MAEYSTIFVRTGGYGIDQEALSNLWQIATDYLEKDAHITVELEGHQMIETDQIAELVEDVFLKSSVIEEVSIRGSNYRVKPNKNFSIKFRRSRMYPGVSFGVSGERQQCTLRRNEVENILRGKRFWYADWIRSDNYYQEILKNVPLSIVAWLACAWIWSRYPDLTWISIGAIYLALHSSLVGTAALLGPFLFPKIIFEIGISARFGKRAEYWRNFFGVAVIAAFVIGVLTTIFVEWVSRSKGG